MTQTSIKLQTLARRSLLLLPAFLLLSVAVVSFGWYYGDALAAQSQFVETAELSTWLAPSDPQAHAAVAALKAQEFVPTAASEALRENELAVSLSPHDWRYWQTLSTARERTGDGAGAEAAGRRASELAPNYAQIRWLLGNVLLRRGKIDEAFTELKRAAELNPDFAAGLVNTAFQNQKSQGSKDLSLLAAQVGNSAPVRKALINYLVEEKSFDDAIQIWSELPSPQKEEVGKNLTINLLTAKKFRAALELLQQSTTNKTEKPSENRFLNSGFESDIDVAGSSANIFDWQIADGVQPQIALDPGQKHEGARSLVLLFNSLSGQDFRQISQTVVVDSSANYRLQLFARASGTNISNTMRWEIVDAGDNAPLSATPPIAVGDGGWQKIAADFKTAPATEAVTIRLARVPCTLSPCSILGKAWFDDFELQKNVAIDKRQ